jgi:hypothetical protein
MLENLYMAAVRGKKDYAERLVGNFSGLKDILARPPRPRPRPAEKIAA